MVCAHPSRAGLNSGEGDGGSTGWSNAFRSRLYARAPDPEGGELPDANARILERRKANYASRNDELRLRWREGVIEPEPRESPGMTPFDKIDAKDVFLGLVREFERQDRPVSEASRASNYAPRLFSRLPREQRHGFKEADFASAMERLFKAGAIENVDYGRKSDQRRKIVTTDSGAEEAVQYDF
jgi:RecA-family ATPase